MIYTVDFIYETRMGHSKMEFLEMTDVTNFLTSFTEWMVDYDYALLRIDIHYIRKE